MTPTARRPSPRAPLPRVLSALATLLLFASAAQVSFATSATSSFVAREGGRFVLDGATFHVAGANCYYLAYSSGADAGSYEHDWVKEVLDEAQSLELNVLRVWSFQDEWWQRDRALQPAPGQYNERFLVALDGLIVESARRDIRLLLCLTNYWEDYGATRRDAAAARRTAVFFSLRSFAPARRPADPPRASLPLTAQAARSRT